MSAPLAILDIGSNSVRFALLDRDDGGAFFVPGGRKEIATTRLGKGLDQTSRLSAGAMEATVAACLRFCDKAEAAEAPAYAYATSAVRDAENRQELLNDFRETAQGMMENIQETQRDAQQRWAKVAEDIQRELDALKQR